MPAAGDNPAADPDDLDARRWAALSWLAPSIAHELANPLGAILAFAGYLSTDPRLPAELKADARMLREEAARTNRLVGTLLEIARDRPAVATSVDVAPLLDEVLELAAGVTGELDLQRVVAADLPPVETDPSRLRQLLVVMLADALRGLGDRARAGVLRVEATADGDHGIVVVGFGYRRREGHAPDEPEGAARRAPLPAGETPVPALGARFSVERDGGGVPGSGRLTLELPIADRGAPVAAQPPPAPTERSASPITVLVCDDEVPIRTLLVRVLERDGMRTVEAADGPSALAIVESTDVDVVLTDHRMAGMSGLEVYERAVETRPRLGGRFVVMSGEPGSEELARFADRTGVRILPKPFDVQVVAATIREVARAAG